MNDLEWLQALYIAEKKALIDIDTLDNPAWILKIHLTNTSMDGGKFIKVVVDNSEVDWYMCFVKDNIFWGIASPNNFSIVLSILRKWWKNLDWERTSETNDFVWLQEWYRSQCDEDWEHDHGVIIRSSTTDIPSWTLEINFGDTSLEDNSPFSPVAFEIDKSWLRCFVDKTDFKANCSPDQLMEVVRIFRSWAEKNS